MPSLLNAKMKTVKSLVVLILVLLLCALLQYHRSSNLQVSAKTELSASCSEQTTKSFSSLGGEGYDVRHCVTGRMLGRTPANLETVPFDVSGGITSPEVAEQRQASFEDIFKNKVWVDPGERKNENQASGPGSTLHYAQEVISALHSIITQLKRELGVDRIRLLDIPCGDMVWMSRFLRTRDDIQYTGFDIVPDLISRHRKDFVGQSPNWTFRVQDIVRDGLNESYDLILCRMMLQHLFTNDVQTVLKHFSQSGSRFLLTTSFNRVNGNPELPTESGRFRLLNLELPPFSLTPPVCVLRDGLKDGGGKQHFLGLWQLPLRRAKICNSTTPFTVSNFEADFYACVKWS